MNPEMTLTFSTDHSKFERLMSDSYRKVYNMAFRLSGNRSDAEDLTQEAYFRAFRSFKDYEGDRPFENWILRIVSRLFLDLLRSRRRRVQTYSMDAPIERDNGEMPMYTEVADTAPNPEDRLVELCFDETIETAMSALTTEQRELIHMADVLQLSYKEIAEIVGAPVGTIRSRLHRAHKAMRTKIGRTSAYALRG